MGIEGTYLNIVKPIYDKPTANIILNGEKLKALPLRSGIRQGCSCLENPRDGVVWWAAVYGVAQSWTQLKRLRSSSSPLSPLLFNIVQEVLARAIREENEIKAIQIRKEVELSLFAGDMILYIENPKDTIRKLLELISEFIKFTEYNINTQK